MCEFIYIAIVDLYCYEERRERKREREMRERERRERERNIHSFNGNSMWKIKQNIKQEIYIAHTREEATLEVNVESQTRDKTKGVHWLPTIHYEMGGRIKELEATTSRSIS